MLLVDYTLVMDIARKNKRIARIASVHGFSPDETLGSAASRVGREKFFFEFSKGYVEEEE